MVRLSDILKKKMQKTTPSSEETTKKPEASEGLPSASGIQMAKVIPTQESKEQEPKEMRIAKAMKEIQPDIEQFKNIYSRVIQLLKELPVDSKEKKPFELKPFKDQVEDVVNYLVLGDKTFLTFFYDDYPSESYPYNHMVNVMIMSIAIGLSLGYNKSQLNELGLATLLHDLGMLKLRKLVIKTSVLTKDEFNQVKQHPINGEIIISLIKDIPPTLKRAIKEHHEHMDGTGYPAGLKGKDISEYARIIAAVDTYEELTHTRAHRKKYQPHEVIKRMLSINHAFYDPTILKLLVNQVGIYPLSSWVELNTDEIGVVIATNEDYPLRPVIKIIFDLTSERLEEPHLVNLAKQPNLYIKKPLLDKEIQELTKK